MDGLCVEPSNNGASQNREFATCYLDWSARHDVNIVERYLDSDLNLVVRIGDVPRQHVAVIRRLRSIDGIKLGGQGADFVERNAGPARKKSYQPLVLTDVVKPVERQQEPVPSEAWLEVFDRRAIGGGKPLYLFCSSAIPFSEIGTDRKVRVFYESLAVSLGQCGCQDIEATPNGIDNGAGLCVDETGNRLAGIDLPDFFSRLGIFIDARDIWGIVQPRLNTDMERIELGFGPFDAGIGI